MYLPWMHEGNVLTSLQDPNGVHHTNTGALETDNWLYISSLHADNLARISKADARNPMKLYQRPLTTHFFESFREQGDLHFSPVMPNRFDEPVMVSSNRLLAKQLGIDPAELDQPRMLELMAVTFRATTIKPIALVYSGHQFGVWAGQLGDGRAMTLGELPKAKTRPSGIYNLKAQAQPPTPDLPMAAPFCDQVSANTSAPKPCMVWA